MLHQISPVMHLFRENVLTYPKLFIRCVLFQKNVLGGTKWIRESRICRYAGARRLGLVRSGTA